MIFFLLLRSLFPLLFLSACSGLEQSEQEKLRIQNAKGEFVYRCEKERLYEPKEPKYRTREKYPWEEEESSKRTKNF